MPIPRIDLPQGTLDLLILRTLSAGPQHGWAISERVQQVSGEVLRIRQGSSPAKNFLGPMPPFTEPPDGFMMVCGLHLENW
jgi:hypothetical protein